MPGTIKTISTRRMVVPQGLKMSAKTFSLDIKASRRKLAINKQSKNNTNLSLRKTDSYSLDTKWRTSEKRTNSAK